MLYAITVHVYKQPTAVGVLLRTTYDDGGRGQVLSTFSDSCRLVTTLSE